MVYLRVLILLVFGRSRGVQWFIANPISVIWLITGWDWQSFSLVSLGCRGHIINKRFTLDIWIVSEEHWAGLHLESAFHVSSTLYLCHNYTVRGYMYGSWKGRCLASRVLLTFHDQFINSFFVPLLVQTMIAFEIVKSLPRMIGLLCLLHTMNEFVNI